MRGNTGAEMTLGRREGRRADRERDGTRTSTARHRLAVYLSREFSNLSDEFVVLAS